MAFHIIISAPNFMYIIPKCTRFSRCSCMYGEWNWFDTDHQTKHTFFETNDWNNNDALIVDEGSMVRANAPADSNVSVNVFRFSHSRPEYEFFARFASSVRFFVSTKHTYTPVDTAVIINIA